jgi:hypothetical protein
MPKTCPRCFLTDEDDRANCIQRPVMGCPEPVDLEDTGVVMVKCDACSKLVAIPVGNIMQRKRLSELGPCSLDQCAARVVLPPKARSGPPPITDESKAVAGGKGK